MFKPNCILVKTASEISLKTHFVRKYFMDKLVKNIKGLLRARGLSGTRITKKGGRLYIYPNRTANLKKVAKLLPLVFGIHAFALAKSIPNADKEKIVAEALAAAKGHVKKGNGFAVRSTSTGRKDFTKMDLNIEAGSAIMLGIKGLNVNLSKPDKEVFLEARDNKAFIYLDETPSQGGLPLGCEGSVAVLFEGKKPELLAAWLMMKRGCNVFPLVKGTSKKILTHVNKLCRWNNWREFKFTGQGQLGELIEKRGIGVLALVKADTKLSKGFRAFDKKFSLPVFRPLVFYPKELYKEKMGLIG